MCGFGAGWCAVPRSADPDGHVLDADRGRSTPGVKQAQMIGRTEGRDREDTRAGARELDDMVEAMPGLSRMQRDRERAMPRPTPAEVPYPVMARRLPEPDAVRVPLSSRQRKARSKAKRAAQERLTGTQYAAVHELISAPQTWDRINAALSDAAGDAGALDDGTRQRIQRIDRAVQVFEAHNDRGHVVYANVKMPAAINRSNLGGFVRNQFAVGTGVHFDRYTGGRHTLHELEDPQIPADRTVVFEMQTRRGAYLGHSDGVDDTGHLLPRGMRFTVVGTHEARYRRPDGTEGTRHVVQLVDVGTPTQTGAP